MEACSPRMRSMESGKSMPSALKEFTPLLSGSKGSSSYDYSKSRNNSEGIVPLTIETMSDSASSITKKNEEFEGVPIEVWVEEVSKSVKLALPISCKSIIE